MSRKLDGPAGMIGGAHLPSAALLHEAKLGKILLFLVHVNGVLKQQQIIKLICGLILL